MINYGYIFTTKRFEECKTLNNYNNIREKVIIVSEISDDQRKQIENIFNYIHVEELEYFDAFELYDETTQTIDTRVLENQIKRIYNLRPSSNTIYDLRNINQLEKINYWKEHIFNCKIEGLNNLKELKYMNDMVCYDIKEIPNSVTKLQLETNDFRKNRIDLDYKQYPNIKSIEIYHSISCIEEVNEIYLNNTLPPIDVELDELIINIKFPSIIETECTFYSGDELRILLSFKNIKKKTIYFYDKLFPKTETVIKELEKCAEIIFTTKVKVMIENNNPKERYIHEIPDEFIYLQLKNQFTCQIIQKSNPKLFQQMQYLEISHYGDDIVDLQQFINCKGINVFGNYHKILFPKNVETITFDNTHISEPFDFRIFPFLKVVGICFEYDRKYSKHKKMHILLPPKMKLVELVDDNVIIDNLHEIEIDEYYLYDELQGK